ncbi:LOW QUALITY PROTEIN: hypothetical protein V2J09_008319 [Rumex salicifolius]
MTPARENSTMGRQKDVFWNYVEVQDNGGLSCKFCKKEFSGGSSRIKSHLSGIKGRDVTTCPEVPKDVQESALCAIGTPQKRSREETVATASNMLTGLPQSASSDLFRRMDMIEVNEKLIKHLILNNVPLDIIKEPSLLNLLRDVAKLGPRYEPPSYSALVTESLPSFEKEVKRYARTVQKSWGMTGCTLIMDSEGMQSTSPGKCNFIFTAYSPKGMIFLEAPVSHSQMTIQNVRNLVMEILDHESLYISDVIVCDLPVLAEEIVHVDVDSAIHFLVEKCPWISKTKCVQCEIQILLREICCASEWLSDLVEEANSLYTYASRSHLGESWCKSLRKKRPELHSAGIHANSFSQLQSVLELETGFRTQLKRNGQLDESILETIERDEFWKEGKEVLHALSPLIRIPCLLDTLIPTLGYFYQAIEKAGARIAAYCDTNPKFEKIWRFFEDRRTNSILYPIHAAAAYLNPAYMMSEQFKENHEMRQGKIYILEKLVREEDKQAFQEQLHLYDNKDPLLFNGMSTSMLSQYHPVIWWDKFGSNVPVLRKYATRLLSQPCTSLSSYRHNNQLQQPDYYLLRRNTIMMEEFNRLGERVFHFIDLEDLD